MTFDASGSKDPDGTIAKYEWDLDGNGTYETNTGTTADHDALLRQRRHGRRRPAGHRQQRRHRDDDASPSPSRTAPDGLLHRHAEPGPTPNATVSFNASGSSDPDGTIAKYEWDLDGNGSYETNTGTTTRPPSYATAGEVTVGLRVTDNNGATATTTRA